MLDLPKCDKEKTSVLAEMEDIMDSFYRIVEITNSSSRGDALKELSHIIKDPAKAARRASETKKK